MKCESYKCDREAVTAFVWPGQRAMGACMLCALRAHGLAKFMGFELPAGPQWLRQIEVQRAQEVLDHVQDGEQ